MKKSKVLTTVAVSILGVGSIIFGLTGCTEITKPVTKEEAFIEEVQSEIHEISEKEVEERVIAEKEIETEKEENCAVFGSKQIVKPVLSEISDKDETSEEAKTNKAENREKPIKNQTEFKGDETTAQRNNESTTSPQTQKVIEQPVQPQVQEYVSEPEQTLQVEVQVPKGHYEERWVVDSPERVIEEPVYTQESRTICNGCGADITANLDTHMAEHFVTEGSAPSYHDDYVTTTTIQTKVIPEQGHMEKVLIEE